MPVPTHSADRPYQLRINHRRDGGTVTPSYGDWLTLPARSEYHGRRAREFNDLGLELGSTPDTAELINDDDQVSYWLKDEVPHDSAPSVLPTKRNRSRPSNGSHDYVQRQRTGL